MIEQRFEGYLIKCPIIAILRGLTPDNAIEVVKTLLDAGIRIVEVPLNSPTPFRTISMLVDHFGDEMLVGAGTVLTAMDVDRLNENGAHFIVSPNTNIAVIERALHHEMIAIPGVATPTEAFSALKAGTKYLKLFPAKSMGTSMVSALKDVLPQNVHLFAVGGINENTIQDWLKSGCTGVGTGSGLFNNDMTLGKISEKADLLVSACKYKP